VFTAPSNVNFLELRDQNPTSARNGQYLLYNNPDRLAKSNSGCAFSFRSVH
jgi:hypothetical protein